MKPNTACMQWPSSRHAPVAGPMARALASCVLLFFVLLSGCAKTPPEEALRARVAALQQSLEARDAAAMEAMLDADFIGPDGMDRRDARRMATLLLFRQQQVGVTSGPLDVRLQGDDRATVAATVALTGGSGRLLPDSAQAWRVESGWRLRGGDWYMTSIAWTPALR
ncbi:nuclear transport factor 2 family protein [Luteimonas sp. BDR2-5]|uniref:nuclear transport factor 2 family protein n=1 Tax=Proluteimonas luteida TaxID=2878685 RepID=UPI001E393153|nr:nuclear transport factor 2 family protein [Luteimonas sp. BDR2-5]MCD9026900.1 nuclear transport factor 2 family protein [Luteimonas sp. BDR2-5]